MDTKEIIEKIKSIERDGKSGAGKTHLLKYLNGEKLTRGQALKAHCYDCMGYYGDGRIDCEDPACPLYPFMPYRKD